jgi:hypothetical protein
MPPSSVAARSPAPAALGFGPDAVSASARLLAESVTVFKERLVGASLAQDAAAASDRVDAVARGPQ